MPGTWVVNHAQLLQMATFLKLVGAIFIVSLNSLNLVPTLAPWRTYPSPPQHTDIHLLVPYCKTGCCEEIGKYKPVKKWPCIQVLAITQPPSIHGR